MARAIFLLSALAATVWAGPKKGAIEDEVHPRSPGTPLEIKFTPYYCSKCVQEDRIEAEEQSVQMMRMPVADLAKELGLAKDWIVVETQSFKILSTLTKTKVKYKYGRFIKADLTRLKTIFPKLKLGREGASLNAHQRVHLYHIRVERVYQHFAALTDNKKRFLGMEGPYQLFLLDDYQEYYNWSDKFIGRGQKMAGVQDHQKDNPNFNCFGTSEQQVGRSKGKGDALFRNWVIHNVAHLLADGHLNYYRQTWGWLEEGIGHYYERRESPRYNTFCWSEGKPPSTFEKPDWESIIFGLVRRGKDDPLSNWCEKLEPGQLSGTQNGMSWSIVKWLIETEPIRFTKMLRKLDDYENKPDCATCIEFAFGVSPSVLHSRWREYVLEKYKK